MSGPDEWLPPVQAGTKTGLSPGGPTSILTKRTQLRVRARFDKTNPTARYSAGVRISVCFRSNAGVTPNIRLNDRVICA